MQWRAELPLNLRDTVQRSGVSRLISVLPAEVPAY
jgi:hypothetical protein